MKKSLLIALAVLAAAAGHAQPLLNVSSCEREISVDASFGPCELAACGEKYFRPEIAGLSLLENPGLPALPFCTLRILLPPGMEISEVAVSGEKEVLPRKARIRPAAVPVPWFAEESRGELALEGEVYRNSGYFPGRLSSSCVVTRLAGYPIAACNLYPLQYEPSSGELVFHPRLSIRLTLAPARDWTEVQGSHEGRVAASVLNPELVAAYRSREWQTAAEADVPHVIVTSEKLLNPGVANSFESLAEFLRSKGVESRIVTVEQIYKDFPGKDRAEQVRNFIRNAFQKWNTRYVLLGGDADKGSELVPVRRFKTELFYEYMDGSSMSVKESMASDYYYSALDGDFDGNGNGHYGEPGDNIDLESEVAVGRAPVDTPAQLNNFVRNTLQAYRYAEQCAQPRVLMLGEHLFSPGQCGVKKHIYGASFMNELFEGAGTHGFRTCGFGKSWTLGKLYEKEQSWGASEVKQRLSTFGACWVNHIGHSSPSYNMHLYTQHLSSLTNEVPFLYCTQGCNAGRFTNEGTSPIQQGRDSEERYSDCFAETLVFGEHGAFAVLSNWSYGLSPEDPETSDGDTPGANQYFHRWLVDAFFNPNVRMTRVGDMLSYSRTKMNRWLIDPQMQTQTVRWVYYQFNLLGDPHAPLPAIY